MGKLLSGKVALVTGAGQGVGKEIAEGLAAEGARLVLVDLNPKTLEETVAELNGRFGTGVAVGRTANVASEEEMTAAVRLAVSAFGGLDLAISNAGILKAHKVTEFPVDVWRRIVDVNLVGFLVTAKAAAQVMQAQPSRLQPLLLCRNDRDNRQPQREGKLFEPLNDSSYPFGLVRRFRMHWHLLKVIDEHDAGSRWISLA